MENLAGVCRHYRQIFAYSKLYSIQRNVETFTRRHEMLYFSLIFCVRIARINCITKADAKYRCGKI